MFVYFKLVKFGVTYLSIYVELGQFKERKLKKEENIKKNKRFEEKMTKTQLVFISWFLLKL